MSEYRYGMRLRGFSPGCQPKEGFLNREDSTDSRYYDVLMYNRKLTDKEVADYELDMLSGDTFNVRFKDLRLQLGMSQIAIAQHYGMSKRNVENWEMGLSSPPDWVGRLLLSDMERMIKAE